MVERVKAGFDTPKLASATLGTGALKSRRPPA